MSCRSTCARSAASQDAEQLTPFLTGLFKAVESAPRAAVVFTLAIGKGGKADDAYRDENEDIAAMARRGEASRLARRRCSIRPSRRRRRRCCADGSSRASTTSAPRRSSSLTSGSGRARRSTPARALEREPRRGAAAGLSVPSRRSCRCSPTSSRRSRTSSACAACCACSRRPWRTCGQSSPADATRSTSTT